MSRLRRVEELFHACLGLPPEQRRPHLEAACPDDPELRRDVVDLLERDARTEDSPSPLITPRSGEEIPPVLGPYRLAERLGEGGFGVVYAAEQEAPIRRRVAVKILKAGLDTRAILARFDAEHHALARMNHPGIARVFDAGETERGRPYFVMELVEGVPVTDFCESRRLSLSERLRLFVGVCRAVEHAHQRGVIHRDLKPSNILVTGLDGAPLAKVIDFGIAKATAEARAGFTVKTGAGEFLGTPEYMSPEQAVSGDLEVDTRSDVYSLGVVLYRLLTGALPFEGERLRQAGPAGVQRILAEEEPRRPSEKAREREHRRVSRGATAEPRAVGSGTSDVGAVRATPAAPELERVSGTGGPATRAISSRQLRGDLDSIVMKALEKSRDARYDSPAALAAELERFLRGEPVSAGPAGTWYRVRKFARRRRGIVVSAALVALALLAGLTATSLQAVRAKRAEERARRQAAVAVAVSGFLTKMLTGANPEENPRGQDLTVREMLELAASELRAAPPSSSEVEAALSRALGTTYAGLGLFEEAEPFVRRAVDLSIRSLEQRGLSKYRPDSDTGAGLRPEEDDARRECVECLLSLATLQARQGRYGAADSSLAFAERLAANDSGRDGAAGADPDRFTPQYSVRILQTRGEILANLSRLEEADSCLSASFRLQRTVAPGDPGSLARSLVSLAALRSRRGRMAEAESLGWAGLEATRAAYRGDHHEVAMAAGRLATTLERLGRYAEAESLLLEAEAMQGRVLGAGHPLAAITRSNRGVVLLTMGRVDEAVRCHEEALAVIDARLGPEHPEALVLRSNLATALQTRGDFDRALELRRFVLATQRRVLGDDDHNVAVSLNNTGSLLRLMGRYREAEQIFREAIAAFRRVHGEDHPNVAIGLHNLGRTLLDQGRVTAAEPVLRDAVERAGRVFPPGHVNAAIARATHARALAALGQYGEAETVLVAAHASIQEVLGAQHARTREVAGYVEEVRRARGGTRRVKPE